MVVFPAASSPTINILISFFPNRLLNKLANAPISSLFSLTTSLFQVDISYALSQYKEPQHLLPPSFCGCKLNLIKIRHSNHATSHVPRWIFRGDFYSPPKSWGAKFQLHVSYNAIHPTFGNELYLNLQHKPAPPTILVRLKKGIT